MTANLNRGVKGNTAPRPDSVTDRIRQFYLTNPDEEMTGEDLAVKFDATKNQLDHARKTLAAQGLIETVTVTRAVASKTRRREA
jgi:hypothetical protein